MGWDVGCFTQNVHLNVEFFPPSCGVLYAKRGGGGGDGGVAVWEQLVCDPPMWPACCWERWQLLRSRSPRQRWLLWKQVVNGGGSGCQLVYEVVWWGTFTGITGRCTEHCSHLCLWFPPPLTKGTDPEVCFSNMPECKRLVRAIFLGGGVGPRKVCKQMWTLLEMLGIIPEDRCPKKACFDKC